MSFRLNSILPLLILTYLSSSAWCADPFALLAEYRKIADEKQLWPGFDLRSTPVAIFDGKQTLLFGHPHPPSEFQQMPGHEGVWFFPGQHPDVRANSSHDIGGVSCATVLLSEQSRAPLIVHETFHVFQRAHHPKWVGDEASLFVYPIDDASLLQLRQLETEALRRSLTPKNECWAAEAIRLRRERYKRMPAPLADYERKTELNEGLAQYVENRAGDRQAYLPESGFAADDVRTRCYSTGAAIAAILDRLHPEWIQKIESEQVGSLDEMLESSVSQLHNACSFSAQETQMALDKAKHDISDLQKKQAASRKDFLALPGWRIIIVSEKSPLWPQAFDPWNVQRVSRSEILHTRWLKAGNSSGTIEVLGRVSMTEAAGSHPLFDGIRKLIITGFPNKPQIQEKEGKVTLNSDGLQIELSGADVIYRNQTVLIKIRDAEGAG